MEFAHNSITVDFSFSTSILLCLDLYTLCIAFRSFSVLFRHPINKLIDAKSMTWKLFDDLFVFYWAYCSSMSVLRVDSHTSQNIRFLVVVVVFFSVSMYLWFLFYKHTHTHTHIHTHTLSLSVRLSICHFLRIMFCHLVCK
jgi:hypothetical protein